MGMKITTPFRSAKFGGWAAKSFNTVYQAASDGLVVGFTQRSSGTVQMALKTDSSNPPTVQRQGTETVIDNTCLSVSCPVKKNDFWIVDQAGTVLASGLFFIPLENVWGLV